MPLIQVNNLSKVYESDGLATTALSGVSFGIAPGEFVAIMGPSGSGKSTLLHILGFLDRESSGDYWFDNKRINDYSNDEMAKVRNQKMGFIFQSFNLLRRTTVLENVKLPLLYSDVPEEEWDEKARAAVEAVGLGHRLYHEPAHLSGGEKQRCAIARSLIINPNIIFADEPTGNLDSKSGQIVMEILQKLNHQDGHTIVLITHETYTAEHASRIIRLRDGQVERDEVVSKRRVATNSFVK